MASDHTTAASGAASPLTDDQIKAIHHGLCTTTGANYLSMARAIEAAHGITAGAPAAQEAEPAVPVEPTDEMYVAAGAVELPTGDDDGGSIHLNTSQVRQIWQAMRAALYTHPPRPQADAGAVPDRVRECAERLVAHADFRLGGALNETSRARDIPSAACSQVKSRHLAALRDALAAAPQAPAAGATPRMSLHSAQRLINSYAVRQHDFDTLVEFTTAGVLDMVRAAFALGAADPAQEAPFQQRVQPWLMECFGPMIAGDREERNHRFLEESLELVQACGCSASEAHQLVDYVFGRPVGEPMQEVGGVMVTLAALCLANGLDMHAAGETELARIWTKVEAIRAKQAAKPKHSPLPEHTPTRAADSPQGAPIVWPKARDVGRIGDMSPSANLRVGLDSDNDVFVSVWGEDGGGSVEFCNGGGGGGHSMRTRLALIALMVAMEQDNAERPDLDWWARRMGGATQEGGAA
ncbi:hypothetical protein [Paracidovorax oryzae]|uniref:hypothetical protein n=1 Tax=Paracidovorax oryzae TaxID=862720 RepID=UPI0002FAD0C0|nr:hypothetical protein [Paracidovorax oryzae]